MRIVGAHHVALKVEDVDGGAAFYREVLGLEELTRHTDAAGLRSVWLDAGGVILMLERAGPGPRPAERRFAEDPPGWHLFALRIEPEARAAWRARLEAQGAPVVEESDYTLYVRDPEGNRIGLSTYPERSGP